MVQFMITMFFLPSQVTKSYQIKFTVKMLKLTKQILLFRRKIQVKKSYFGYTDKFRKYLRN